MLFEEEMVLTATDVSGCGVDGGSCGAVMRETNDVFGASTVQTEFKSGLMLLHTVITLAALAAGRIWRR